MVRTLNSGHSVPEEKRSREFSFTQRDFERIREQLYAHAGIVLADHKKDMVYNRMVRRLRQLQLSSFSEYFDYLATEPDEFSDFINALTTNLTAFFREPHHFDYLTSEWLKEKSAQPQRRIRIWSAGCSVGEEPYSLAMALLHAGIDPEEWDIRILATDIDSKVLATARAGIYTAERVASLVDTPFKRWLLRGCGAAAGQVRMCPELQKLISFRELNLMGGWPMKGPFDVIFCRNVMIYFDQATQADLLDRMAELLIPGGILMVGHSESPSRLTNRFRLIGKTIYKRIC